MTTLYKVGFNFKQFYINIDKVRLNLTPCQFNTLHSVWMQLTDILNVNKFSEDLCSPICVIWFSYT